MRDYRTVRVWERAPALTLSLYSLTRSFPRDEMYGLTSQIRRSAASISANIAEGCGRRGQKELARFLSMAAGSASELDYHLLLAADLGLVDGPRYKSLSGALVEVRRMLSAFIRKLTANSQ